MASKKIPCGGFGYDDNDFEFVTPMGGGIPTLKSKGGAVPEEVTNAIETGGMGWTSEEPVPAINITWDGDTEGRENISNTFYKMSNNILTTKELIGGMLSYNQSEYSSFEITAETIEGSDEALIIRDPNLEDEVVYVVLSDIEDSDMTIHKGIYFLTEDGVFVSSLTKEASTQETVHQIDEKYIPSSGGAVVVEFVYDPENESVVANYTPEEVYEMAQTQCVIGVMSVYGNEQPYGAITVYVGGLVGFGCNPETGLPVIYFDLEEMEWEIDLG